MTIAEFVRHKTLHVRDSLEALDIKMKEALKEYEASDSRVKRCGTEISKCRENVFSWKRKNEDIQNEVAMAQKILEELEEKRRVAIDNLMSLQNQLDETDKSKKKANASTQQAIEELKQEQNKAEKAKSEIEKLRANQEAKRKTLNHVMVQALDEFLKLQAQRSDTAFKTQSERTDVMRIQEEFKKARHNDLEISTLCEQYEEINQFLAKAMVPSVQKMLRSKLNEIEKRIEERFPGAFSSTSFKTEEMIDELLYYCNHDGKAVICLPIEKEAWQSATQDKPTNSASHAMCIVWSFIRELNINQSYGVFKESEGQVIFESTINYEDIAIWQGFHVKCGGNNIMRYIFMSVPPELQEALIDENTNL